MSFASNVDSVVQLDSFLRIVQSDVSLTEADMLASAQHLECLSVNAGLLFLHTTFMQMKARSSVVKNQIFQITHYHSGLKHHFITIITPGRKNPQPQVTGA